MLLMAIASFIAHPIQFVRDRRAWDEKTQTRRIKTKIEVCPRCDGTGLDNQELALFSSVECPYLLSHPEWHYKT